MRKWLIAILALIPPVVLIVFIVKYRVEAPLADIWEIVPLIDRAYSGQLTIRDLWELHNEHRPIFSRAVLIYLARLTHWTVLYELLTNVLLASITFLSLFHLLKKTDMEIGVLVPTISLLIFSLNQSEAWFGAYNVQIYMSIMAVTLGVILLTLSEHNLARTIAAAFLGIIATYTFANGLLFWPIGMWILWRKKQAKLIAFWVLISTVTILFYFWGYQRPPHHPSPLAFLEHPVRALNYVFAYLGAPLFAFCKKWQAVAEWLSQKGWSVPSSLIWVFQNASSIAGAFGLLTFVYLYMKTQKQNGIVISLLTLAAYVIFSALLSSAGRSAIGIQNALSLRYVPISTLFWISLLVMLKLAAVKPRIFNFSVAIVLVCVILNSIYGGLYAMKQHAYLMPARSELYRMQDKELLKRLFPDPEYIRQSVPTLKKHHLSVFQDEK
jgi:hypothetical protein